MKNFDIKYIPDSLYNEIYVDGILTGIAAKYMTRKDIVLFYEQCNMFPITCLELEKQRRPEDLTE